MQIGRKVVSNDNPFIIATLHHDIKVLEDLEKNAEAAIQAGADAVKIDYVSGKELYGVTEGKQVIPLEYVNKIKSLTDSKGSELLVSVHSTQGAWDVDQYVNAHIVSSDELTNLDLLKVIDELGKPVILTTGGANHGDIELALGAINSIPIILNYCVYSFPAREVDLFVMEDLKKYGHPVGFTDHTPSTNYLPRSSIVNHGGVVLEKEFSTAKTLRSLQPHEFKKMVDYIRGLRPSIVGATREENTFTTLYRRRLVALKNIKQLETLKLDDNYGSYRPGGLDSEGLSGQYARNVNGLIAKCDITKGSTIKHVDVY